jgi:integrase
MRTFRPFQVRLPSGDRYWTVVDPAYRPVAEADEWLLHVRPGRDCAESTTEAYARSLGLFLDWCAATGLDWRQAPGHFGRFVYWVQRYDPNAPAYAQVRVVRGARRVNAVLAAVREFFRHAVATGLADKAVLDALFDLAEDYDLPAEVRGDRTGLRLRSRPRHRLQEPQRVVDAASDEESPGAAAGLPQRPGPVHRAGTVADRPPPRRPYRRPAGGRALRAGRHPAGLPDQGRALACPSARQPQRATTSPDEEQRNDVWDLGVLGLGGSLGFTALSQQWLRETAKLWAAEEIPRHRGRQAAHTAKGVVAMLGDLSASLRLTRDDRGEHPAALSRRDIVAFTSRLAHQHRAGQISELTRLRACRSLRRFLADIRAMGLTRADGTAAGLPDDVVMGRQDIPPEPDPDEQGRDLPAWVMQILDANLHVLEERSGTDMRRMTELMIDTGRRPDEICQLRLDCLTRDAHGKPVLIYTDSKNHRPGRRLPVAEATARIITSQQADVRARFAATPVSDLPLFPRDKTNPHGTGTYSEAVFTSAHRKWVDLIAGQLVTTVTGEDGTQHEQVFDRLAVIPYAYRHSYAQRHADQGVPPDVLRDLLGHDAIQTTLGHYRVTEKRVRTAVDRVSAHQFDNQGRRVMLGIRGLLADEHARMRIGQVAVPFGICTEPSNVKAGGQACPYKFTCLGCGHFRSDPSYLPELKSYLQQLLADREQVQAATDLQDWAKDQLTPREEEITQLRELIRRIEADLDDLTEHDRALIHDAVTVIRKTRQLVNLGMPTVRPAASAG